MHLPLTSSQEIALGLMQARGILRAGDHPNVTLNTIKALRDLGLVAMRTTEAGWSATLSADTIVEVVVPEPPKRRRRRKR